MREGGRGSTPGRARARDQPLRTPTGLLYGAIMICSVLMWQCADAAVCGCGCLSPYGPVGAPSFKFSKWRPRRAEPRRPTHSHALRARACTCVRAQGTQTHARRSLIRTRVQPTIDAGGVAHCLSQSSPAESLLSRRRPSPARKRPGTSSREREAIGWLLRMKVAYLSAECLRLW
jgi:hypothetical protein